MYPGLKRAKIVQLVITKARRAYLIALGAFLGSIKIKKARLRVKIALKTRRQPIANVPHHVTHVVQVGRHQTEVCHVRNVWPGNSKNPQARAERIVPFVYPASTRTFQTCHRASSAHVGMRNRLRNKRRALNAAPVNSMTMLVPVHANHV